MTIIQVRGVSSVGKLHPSPEAVGRSKGQGGQFLQADSEVFLGVQACSRSRRGSQLRVSEQPEERSRV